MKKISTIVMALALVLGLSQCKKNEQNNAENQNDPVTITLNVSGNNGSRVIVNPATGTVDFENNDQIIVASGGKYVGTLTYNGSLFTGAISNATEGYPLQFYFLGNVTPAETLTSGVTESCSVIISDQTEHLPVISAALSNENYYSSTTNYTAHLLNKCALVKFNVTTASEAAICVTGFNNKVTVSFAENTFTNSKTGGGNIILPTGNGAKWAILLPQEAMEAGEMGSAYSQDGEYSGIRGAVPAIYENGYLTNGIVVTVNTSAASQVPTGAINGLFTVGSNNKQVYFSQGNLQYCPAENNWRFAEAQFDVIHCVEGGGIYVTDEYNENYTGWIDHFGWGTSGINHGATYYQPWSTQDNNAGYYAYGLWNANLYDNDGKADWGYNAISNGGNMENQWRTLTYDEWNYVLFSRYTLSGIRFAKACVNGRNGLILLPDDWNESIHSLLDVNQTGGPYSNVITIGEWDTMESYGAIFLPVGGVRSSYNLYNMVREGYYWSSSYYNVDKAYHLYFSSNNLFTYGYNNNKSTGMSIRLVRDAH